MEKTEKKQDIILDVDDSSSSPQFFSVFAFSVRDIRCWTSRPRVEDAVFGHSAIRPKRPRVEIRFRVECVVQHVVSEQRPTNEHVIKWPHPRHSSCQQFITRQYYQLPTYAILGDHVQYSTAWFVAWSNRRVWTSERVSARHQNAPRTLDT